MMKPLGALTGMTIEAKKRHPGTRHDHWSLAMTMNNRWMNDIYHKSMDSGSIYDIIDDYGYQYDIFHDNEQHWMFMDFFDRFLIPRKGCKKGSNR